MNIYIPKHIREIGVVAKMCELIEKYSDPDEGYILDPTTAFNNYYYYLNTDPVNRFLHFCISETNWKEEHPNEDYELVISYISRLFYSVKGTTKVFNFMGKYLELDIKDFEYTVKTLKFTITEITLVDIDEKIFYNALLDFLSALLYFGKAEIKIEKINLHLSNTLRNYTGVNIETYQEYTAVSYDE